MTARTEETGEAVVFSTARRHEGKKTINILLPARKGAMHALLKAHWRNDKEEARFGEGN